MSEYAVADTHGVPDPYGIYAPLFSPAFTGVPTAPTPADGDNSTKIATTAFVTAALGGGGAHAVEVVTGNSVTIAAGGNAYLTWDVKSAGSTLLNLADPANPTIITAGTYAIAVTVAGDALTAGKEFQIDLGFGGVPPEAGVSEQSTTARGGGAGMLTGATLVKYYAAGEVVNLLCGNFDSAARNFNLNSAVVQQLGGGAGGSGSVDLSAYAPLASPAFTGTPTAPTPLTANNSTQIATTAFVKAQGYAPLASPAFTGSPTAPTPSAQDSSTLIATTAFVATSFAPLASPAFTGTPTAPTPNSSVDNTTKIATTAWVNTFVSGKAPLASPAFTGTPTAPTALTADNSTQIATTAFVKAQAYAPLASPAFTGTPTAPTAAAGTNSTQVATTAFVATSFAPLASPAFTGTPTAPTAAAGTNTTQVATTAFVTAAVAAGGGGGGSGGIHSAATLASGAGGTLTPNLANGQAFGFDLTGNGNLTIAAPTNGPTTAQTAWISIWVLNDPGNTTSTLTWNAAYVFSTITKPATLAQGASFFIFFVWNPYLSKWDAVAKL